MADEESDSESEEVVDKSPKNFFERQISSFNKDPFQFSLQILILFGAIYVYYIIAYEFVRQSLLNLTKDRIQSLDLPFVLLDEAVDSYTTYVTTILSIAVVFGFYSLGAGNLTPRQYDIRAQLLALLAALPFISYFVLHIMWLKENDTSWYFDLLFMEEMSGFTLSNEWPFETVLQDSRWAFYRVGLYNAIRVCTGCNRRASLVYRNCWISGRWRSGQSHGLQEC